MEKVFDKYIWGIWLKYCLTVCSLISVTMLFIPNLPEDQEYIKYIIGVIIILLLIVSYFVIAIYQINSKKVKLKINNTEVNIFFWRYITQEGKKVIAFNEYYDTQVDDIIIAKKSLNGQVLNKGLIDKKKFDTKVELNNYLIEGELNKNRKIGKKQKYQLGQIQQYEDYFALAFTKFNNDNEACLYSNEYSNCLLEMWKQLNKYYAQNVVNIPLLGAGITRILDSADVKNQELLEIMLQTLRISKMTFKEPSKINIILYSGKGNLDEKEYDLIRIKSLFKGK